MNKLLITVAAVALIVLGVGAYFFAPSFFATNKVPQPAVVGTIPTGNEQATTTQERKDVSTIGTSAGGHDLLAYHYGTGDTELLFVGGIHGGYSWNTVLVAYELMDYLEAHPAAVPSNVMVTVIPVLNPDGLNKVVGTTTRFSQADVPSSQSQTIPGRFNANTVDLNRNFDCEWQSKGTWQNTSVSGGTKAFSEPESQAIKVYVETYAPSAVVVWYSAAGGVFASSCHNGVSAETTALTKKYAEASGYTAYQSFNFYEITGDMVNWLAKQKIPAISVLLTSHTAVEWDKNWKGINALLQYYAK